MFSRSKPSQYLPTNILHKIIQMVMLYQDPGGKSVGTTPTAFDVTVPNFLTTPLNTSEGEKEMLMRRIQEKDDKIDELREQIRAMKVNN